MTSGEGADAFCRTTTSPAPAGYNPAGVGACWVGDAGRAVDLAWPVGSHIAFSLSAAASKQVDLQDATRLADRAFAAWNAATCPGGGTINVQAFDRGPVDAAQAAQDCGLSPCGPSVHDPLHVIVFRDDGWPYNDPVQTLALTTVTFGVDSGTIYDADIEINSSDPTTHPLTTQEPPPAGAYDLQAILTHEAGHFLGLAHATDPQAIMYAYYSPGSISLQPDDLAGICAAYPPVSPAGGGCAIAALPATGRGWSLAAVGAGIFGLRARRRRRVGSSRPPG